MISDDNKPLDIDDRFWKEATAYFGDSQKPLAWFQRPNLALGGEFPEEYCKNYSNGQQSIVDLINRMKHSMIS